MGFVHDTQMRKFIFPSDIQKTLGTWTATLASNVASDVRTAADAAFTLIVPIKLPSNAAALKGAYLKSIDVWYKIATAACDDFATVGLDKMTLPASGSAVSGAAVTVTCDAAHDTPAERLAVDTHKMTVTLTTPVWIGAGEAFVLSMVVDAAATTVFTLYGAQANYTERL